MKEKIFQILDELSIEYENYQHEPAFTCDDAKGIDVPGMRVKSLLLKNKKKDKLYMVVLADEKKLDSNIIRKHFGEQKVSFASEELMIQKIGVKPGHVSPFALINNTENDIILVFDKDLEDEIIGIHPGQNDNTTVLHTKNILKFAIKSQNNYEFVQF